MLRNESAEFRLDCGLNHITHTRTHTLDTFIYIQHSTHLIIGPINIKWALTKYGHIQALNDNSCPFVSLLIYIYSVSLFVFHETENKKIEAANKTKNQEHCVDILHYDIY